MAKARSWLACMAWSNMVFPFLCGYTESIWSPVPAIGNRTVLYRLCRFDSYPAAGYLNNLPLMSLDGPGNGFVADPESSFNQIERGFLQFDRVEFNGDLGWANRLRNKNKLAGMLVQIDRAGRFQQ